MTGQLDIEARVARVATAAGGGGLLAACFLPWLRSGHRARSSFELLGSVDRLGFLHGPFVTTLAMAWMFIPLAVVLGWMATALGRHRLAAGMALVTGLFALGFAGLLRQAGPPLVGVEVALVAGVVCCAGGFAGLVVPSLREGTP